MSVSDWAVGDEIVFDSIGMLVSLAVQCAVNNELDRKLPDFLAE